MKHSYTKSAKGYNWSALRSAAILLLLMTAAVTGLRAQVAPYVFSQSSGTYTPISGGNVLGNDFNDDNNFNNLPIGFPFWYNGQLYTTFSVNANGFIAFGNTITSSYQSISGGGTNNIFSAYNYDIQAIAGIGDLRYETIGTSPNRTLVVQWSNYQAWATTGDNFHFQIRINENGYTLQSVYGAYTIANTRVAQVGLRGNNNTDFNNREVSNGINTWATSTAGGFNFATAEVNNALVPANGQTYTWTPPTPPAPPINMTFTGVTATGMTVNWVDNSTDENLFAVYRSLDGINYNFIANVTSTSTGTTGTGYNLPQTGLFTNTLYYWRVYSVNQTPSVPLSGQQSTSPGTMCGTYTIGPTGAYPSLTAAIAAVQTNGILCPLIFELQAAYVSTVETFPINVPFLGSGPGTGITVRPELAATNLSITTGLTTQTIDLSGATYFGFDGRPGGVGVVSHLTLANTLTTGNAVRFINDAQNCTLNYITVRGVTTGTTNGVINFSSALTQGNMNNLITNCDIGSGGTPAQMLLYANSLTANIFNTNNTISNNNFHDWFNATGTSAAINLSGNHANWIISGNSFYQPITRNMTGVQINYGIFINTATGTGGHTVSGNFIGGNAPNCGGTPYTTTGASGHRFFGINVSTGSVGANSIQGNTITNFNFTTTSASTTLGGIWCGINLAGTNAIHNVGTVTPNVIGSNTVNNQITTSSSGTGGTVMGINSSASGTTTITGNQIGGITANSSSGTISSSIIAINVTSGVNVTVNNNVIGSTTLTNSLINAPSTGATAGVITGIQSSAFTTGPGTVISGNTISNLTNRYAGTSPSGQIRGIVTTSGINTITNNTINALSILTTQAGTTTAASVIGISQAATSAGTQTVSLNTITSLGNGAMTGNVQVIGINATSSTGVGSSYQVHRNQVRGLAVATSGQGVMHGIQVNGGFGRVYNNMIVLGVDATGTPITLPREFNGITKNTANRSTIVFNSVHIAGTGVATGTQNTYAFRRLSGPGSAPADSVFNNVFANTRSNATTGGVHYSLGIQNATQFRSNTNNLFGNGTGYMTALVGVTQYATLGAWTIATGQDVNSFSNNPNFMTSTNLHINNLTVSVLESRATTFGGITIDIDNDLRPGPVGSVNGGATAPDIGADEFDGIPIQVDMGASALVRPLTTGCHGSADSVVIQVTNYSAVTLNMVTNPLTVNAYTQGINPQVFPPVTINTGTLVGGATMNVTVSTTYNMTAVGTHIFRAYTSVAPPGSDIVTSNDSMNAVSILVSGGTSLAMSSTICQGDSTSLTVSGYTNGGTIQWQSSPDGITWTNIPGATNPTLNTGSLSDTTYYRAVNCGLHNSTNDTVNVPFLAPAVTNGDTRCGTGTVNLSASGSGTLEWYTAPTGGTLVNTGTTYSPTIGTTTTYYVQSTYTTGVPGTPPAPTCYPTYSIACSSNDYIDDFSTTGGITNITNMNTACNGILPTNTTFFPGQVVTCPAGGSFNLSTQSGSFSQGFRLWIDYNADGDFADPGEDVWNSGFSGTGVFTGTVVVPPGTTSGPKRMRLMCRFAIVPSATDYCISSASFGETEEYTLLVQLICAAPRTPVTATVNPAPPITLTAADTVVCNNDSLMFDVSSGNPGYEYTWLPQAEFYPNIGDTAFFFGNSSMDIVVFANDTASGCALYDTIAVTVNAAPFGYAATATPDTACVGTQIQLNVATPPALSQVGTQTGQNTTTSYPAPYGNFYWGARHQFLITAAEMTAAGMIAGPINSLAFHIVSTTSPMLQGFTISMGMTGITNITTFQSGLTQVYGPVNHLPTVGLNTHTFTTPFTWDGVSNVIIETCFNNTSFVTNAIHQWTATSYTASVYYRADALGVCGNTLVTGTSINRPVMSFTQNFPYTFGWTPAAVMSNPSINNPTTILPGSSTYTVTATDTITGCVSRDSAFVFALPTPVQALGADTVVCSASTPLTLDAGPGNYTYIWSDATTAQTTTVSNTDTVMVTVTDTASGCAMADTIAVRVDQSPVFTLGNDSTLCSIQAPYFLNGLPGNYTYLWSDSTMNDSLPVNTTGTFWLLVTDTANTCTFRDTATITINPTPFFTLGIDTAICDYTAPLWLNGLPGNYTYLWSDMTTNDSLGVVTTGPYTLLVTDTSNGCTFTDSIQVVVNAPPAFTLGADTVLCSSEAPIFLVGTINPGYTYNWNTGATIHYISVNSTNTYWLTQTETATGCSFTDSMDVTVNPSPVVNLGSDTMICGTQYTYNAPSGPFSYLWSDGTTLQNNTLMGTDTVWVQVTDNSSGCATTDTVSIWMNAPPVTTFQFTQDTICLGDSPIGLFASPFGGTFSGSNGVTSNMLFNPQMAGPGVHTVMYTYTDGNGCANQTSDNIFVSNCVGMGEFGIAAGVNVFPNPNNGAFVLTIEHADFNEMSLEIMSVEGKLVFSDKVSNVKGTYVRRLDLTGFANGTYYLRITTDSETVIRKVVRQE